MPCVRCSVVDTATSGAATDLVITAPAGTTWRQVAGEVRAAAGLAADVQLTVDHDPVADGALLGHPPLLHGALLVAAATAGLPARARGALELHVVGGPDSGRIHLLRPGAYRIGRAPSCDVRLDDPNVSRRHAHLTVNATGVTVSDLRSVNGTSVDGLRLDDDPHPIGPAQRIRVGDSTLVVRSPAVRLASTRVSGQGTVEVNRAPRPHPTSAPVELRRPARPLPPPPPRWPWLAMLLPVAVAVPIALVTRQPIFLLFALMSPVMMVGNALSDRTRGRREHREAERSWQDESAAVSARLHAALAEELTARRARSPDPAELLRAVTRPTARLWERGPGSPDALDLILGAGRLRADVRLSAQDGAPEPQHLDDAPVVVPLRAHGHLGVAGPRHQVLSVARHLVCQLLAWHGPQLVQLVVLACDEGWAWTRWLPHLRGARPARDVEQAQQVVAALHDLAAGRREDGAGWRGPYLVVLIDAASSMRSLPGLADLLALGPCVGIHAICLDVDLSGLAGECRATFELLPRGGRLVTDEHTIEPVRWDGVGAGWADTVGRTLAGLRDATPETGSARLPDDVRLADLLGVDATDPDQVLAGWTRCAASTSAVVGVDCDGPAVVDLRRDGPHALVAGTTGAGKSELLQTLVTALAVANRPDEMSFVLVDYKGGAAFSGCVDLPHTAGLVTDLDEHLAERALTSLGAELTRRERALKARDCKDIEAYQRARVTDASLPALARLVVVIDEFRLLAEELPTFVTGLVRVAAVGRSLGVHLVLATQRPGGIVNADIKANVNLRIALRVRDRADSDDVVDAPDAARIDVATPGRALCRSGSGPLRAVQIARVTGSSRTSDTAEIQVVRADAAPAPATPETTGDDDLARIVAGLREAAARGQIDPAPVAWLPPLPSSLPHEDLPAGGVDDGIGLGLVDLPAEQRQPVLRWHPVDDGHLGICGGPRSGRTSALATIALALAGAHPPDDLHLYVVDAAAGQLRTLEALPHTATALTRDQPRLVARLVSRLAAEVRRRLDGADAGDEPALVLLIDGWDALVETLDGIDHGSTSEALMALLRDGRAAGLRAVVAGHRALLTSRLTSVVPDRLLLAVTDPTDLLLAGLPAAACAGSPLPGRAVRTNDGATAQLAMPAGGFDPAITQTAARARERWPASPPAVARVSELPTSVMLDQLTARAAPGTGVLMGVGGDQAGPLRLDLGQHPVAVVAGPAGSGRSTTLLTVAKGLRRAAVPVVAVCPRRSPLDAGPWPVLGAQDEHLLARHLAADPLTCVLADDAELLADSPLDALLAELAQRRGPGAVVVAGATSWLLGAFRGAAASARGARTGVLLRPCAPADGEVLGVRAELTDRSAVGRGLLVVGGEQQPLQVAW